MSQAPNYLARVLDREGGLGLESFFSGFAFSLPARTYVSGYFRSPSLRDYPARTRAFSIDEILNAVANVDDVDVSECAKFRSHAAEKTKDSVSRKGFDNVYEKLKKSQKKLAEYKDELANDKKALAKCEKNAERLRRKVLSRGESRDLADVVQKISETKSRETRGLLQIAKYSLFAAFVVLTILLLMLVLSTGTNTQLALLSVAYFALLFSMYAVSNASSSKQRDE